MDNRYKWNQQHRGGGGGYQQQHQSNNSYAKRRNKNYYQQKHLQTQQQQPQQHQLQQQQQHPPSRDCRGGGGGGAWQPLEPERNSDVVTLIVENNNLKRMILLHMNLMQEQTDQLKAKDKDLDDQCGRIKTLLSHNQELIEQIAKLNQRIDDLRQQLRRRVQRSADDNEESMMPKAKLQRYLEKETQTSLQEEEEELHCYPLQPAEQQQLQQQQLEEQPPNVMVPLGSKTRGEFNGGKKVSTIFLHRVHQESSFQLQHGEEHEMEEDVDVDGVVMEVVEEQVEEEVEEEQEQQIYHDDMEVVAETEIGAEEELLTVEAAGDNDPLNNGHVYEEEVVAEEIINNCDEHNLWQAEAAAEEVEQVVQEEQQQQIFVTEEGNITEVATFSHSTPQRRTSSETTQEHQEDVEEQQQLDEEQEQKIVEEAVEDPELHLEYAMKQLNQRAKECRQTFLEYQEEQKAFEQNVSHSINHSKSSVNATTELEEVASTTLAKTQVKLSTVVGNHQEAKQQHQKDRLATKTKQKATTTTFYDKVASAARPLKQQQELELQQKVRDLKKKQELQRNRELELQERERETEREQKEQAKRELEKARKLQKELEEEQQKQRELELQEREREAERDLQKQRELLRKQEEQEKREKRQQEKVRKFQKELEEEQQQQRERMLAEQKKERELQNEKELKREQKLREREKERERKQREQRKREQQEAKSQATASKQPEQQQPEPNIEEETMRKLQAHLQKQQQRLQLKQQNQQQPFVRLKKAALHQSQTLIYPPTITPAPSPTNTTGASPKLKLTNSSSSSSSTTITTTVPAATTTTTLTATPLTPQSISSVGSNSNSKSDINISSNNNNNNNNRRNVNNCAPQTYNKTSQRSNKSSSRFVTSLQPYTTRSWEDQEFHCDNEFFLEEAEELLADHPSLEIPKWKTVIYKPSSDQHDIELLSDEAFERRHEKHVRDEVDRKKRDARAIRDQNYYESLRQRHNQDEVLVSLAPLPTSTFYPLPSDIEYVQFVGEVPVQAFGENMVNLKPENEHFTLPWLDAASEAHPVATLDSKKLPTTKAEAKVLQNNSSYVFLKRRKRQRRR